MDAPRKVRRKSLRIKKKVEFYGVLTQTPEPTARERRYRARVSRSLTRDFLIDCARSLTPRGRSSSLPVRSRSTAASEVEVESAGLDTQRSRCRRRLVRSTCTPDRQVEVEFDRLTTPRRSRRLSRNKSAPNTKVDVNSLETRLRSNSRRSVRNASAPSREVEIEVKCTGLETPRRNVRRSVRNKSTPLNLYTMSSSGTDFDDVPSDTDSDSDYVPHHGRGKLKVPGIEDSGALEDSETEIVSEQLEDPEDPDHLRDTELLPSNLSTVKAAELDGRGQLDLDTTTKVNNSSDEELSEHSAMEPSASSDDEEIPEPSAENPSPHFTTRNRMTQGIQDPNPSDGEEDTPQTLDLEQPTANDSNLEIANLTDGETTEDFLDITTASENDDGDLADVSSLSDGSIVPAIGQGLESTKSKSDGKLALVSRSIQTSTGVTVDRGTSPIADITKDKNKNADAPVEPSRSIQSPKVITVDRGSSPIIFDINKDRKNADELVNASAGLNEISKDEAVDKGVDTVEDAEQESVEPLIPDLRPIVSRQVTRSSNNAQSNQISKDGDVDEALETSVDREQGSIVLPLIPEVRPVDSRRVSLSWNKANETIQGSTSLPAGEVVSGDALPCVTPPMLIPDLIIDMWAPLNAPSIFPVCRKVGNGWKVKSIISYSFSLSEPAYLMEFSGAKEQERCWVLHSEAFRTFPAHVQLFLHKRRIRFNNPMLDVHLLPDFDPRDVTKFKQINEPSNPSKP